MSHIAESGEEVCQQQGSHVLVRSAPDRLSRRQKVWHAADRVDGLGECPLPRLHQGARRFAHLRRLVSHPATRAQFRHLIVLALVALARLELKLGRIDEIWEVMPH